MKMEITAQHRPTILHFIDGAGFMFILIRGIKCISLTSLSAFFLLMHVFEMENNKFKLLIKLILIQT